MQYKEYAVLLLGETSDIMTLTKGDPYNFIKVDGKQVRSEIKQKAIYILDNMNLARSIDFRAKEEVKGIVLVLVSAAPNYRNYQQFLGRVGRQGDACYRVRTCKPIDAMRNTQYV